MYTDSLCMYHWMINVLTSKSQLNTKATSEILTRQLLDILTSLIEVYNLSVNVALVKSDQNQAHLLTRVLYLWLNTVQKKLELWILGMLWLQKSWALHIWPRFTNTTSTLELKRHCISKEESTLFFKRRVNPVHIEGSSKVSCSECEKWQSVNPVWPARYEHHTLQQLSLFDIAAPHSFWSGNHCFSKILLK